MTRITNTLEKTKPTTLPEVYGVEFFHIYTDENIGPEHTASIDYLKAVQKVWSFPYDLIILVDDYNPLDHKLTEDDILKYLEAEGVMPNFIALESDLLNNAKIFLDSINNRHLKKSYISYIARHGKYPCSLLSAAWYLTRLGKLDAREVIKVPRNPNKKYVKADRLVNILPQNYKDIEQRARDLIINSSFSEEADKIQDLFYPANTSRPLDLF